MRHGYPDDAVWAWRTGLPCVRTALFLRAFDKLDCAANASKMYIGILCILATNGGVHALT